MSNRNGFSTTEVVVGGLLVAACSIIGSYYAFKPSKEEEESLTKILDFGRANNILQENGEVDLAATMAKIEELAGENIIEVLVPTRSDKEIYNERFNILKKRGTYDMFVQAYLNIKKEIYKNKDAFNSHQRFLAMLFYISDIKRDFNHPHREWFFQSIAALKEEVTLLVENPSDNYLLAVELLARSISKGEPLIVNQTTRAMAEASKAH